MAQHGSWACAWGASVTAGTFTSLTDSVIVEIKEQAASSVDHNTEYGLGQLYAEAWIVGPSTTAYCIAFWDGGTQTGKADPLNANDGPFAAINLPEGAGTYSISVQESKGPVAPNVLPPTFSEPRYLGTQAGNVLVSTAPSGSGTFTPGILNAPLKPYQWWPCPWPIANSGQNHNYGPFP
jgi:hypothetical protein